MDKKQFILDGKAILGIEFGSTRIKGVLIDDNGEVLAVGGYDWENSLVNGIWTYSLDEIYAGLKGSYASLKNDVKERYGITLKNLKALGISGMMHGYLPFDDEGNLLIPIIKKEENDFHRLIDVLKTTISTGLKNNVGTLLADYGIKNEKLGIVILYHEVMWDIIDLLIKEQGLVIPEIVKDGKADKTQLKNVSFFVEDGLFQ